MRRQRKTRRGMARFGFWTIMVAFTGMAVAQEPEPQPTLAQGQALVQAGEAAKAIEVLEAVVEQSPKSGDAWTALAQARVAAEQWEPALTAWLKAASWVSSPRRRDARLFSAAQAQGRLGRSEEALTLLRRLRDANLADLTNIDADPAFESLRQDSRFLALQPTAEELAQPFVEDIEVLHQWIGEAAGDNFGWIARNLGDVDGDGLGDVVTSAPRKDLDGATAGRVYVYSSKSGKLLWSRDGAPGDLLGRGVEAAGDVNGDGVPDVVASAPGGDRVDVYSGKDGATLLSVEAAQPGEAIGQHVKGIGDWNGDGRDDILVGAPQFDPPGASMDDAGRVAVYSGADGSLLWQRVGEQAGGRLGETVAGGFDGKRLVLMAGAPGIGQALVYHPESEKSAFTFHAEISGQSFGGMFMSVVGDVDADGLGDLYISDWQDGAVGPGSGRIYVYSGANGRRLLTLTGEAAAEGFGIGSAEAGDVNGDGHADLVVGAWRHASKAPGAGKVYVISGQDGSRLRTITAKVPGETFGFDAQGLGDINGDGAVDFLLSSAWSRVAGPQSGRVFVIAGEPAR